MKFKYTKTQNPYIRKDKPYSMKPYQDYSKQEVDRMLLDNQFNIHCIVCGSPPVYRIVPKDDKLLSIEIQDRGYICQYCVDQKYLDPAQYGLRQLKRG
jgi:hypothetical protein